MKLIAIGDNVVDIYVNQRLYYPGGNALNVAAYASMQGIAAEYMGIFGNDAYAAHVKQVLEKLQIPFSRSRCAAGENGYAMVALMDHDRQFLRSNQGGISKTTPWNFTPEDYAHIRQFDLIHTSCHSYIDDELASLRRHTSVPISYDFSGKWSHECFTVVCPNIDFAFFSAGDISKQALLDAHAEVMKNGCRLSIATMGSEGASIYDGTREYRSKPAPVRVQDTMGAGDAFLTAFLVQYLSLELAQNERIETAMRAAHAFAGHIIGLDGAFGHPHPYEPDQSCSNPLQSGEGGKR